MTTAFLTVQTEQKIAWLQFVDDDGDVSGSPPAGAEVTFGCEPAGVCRVNTPDHAHVASLDKLVEGHATLTATVEGVDVAPLPIEINAAGELVATDPDGPYIRGAA